MFKLFHGRKIVGETLLSSKWSIQLKQGQSPQNISKFKIKWRNPNLAYTQY